MKNILKEISKIMILGGVLIALQAIAFTDAPCAPPNCNVPAPINVGSQAQTKSGGLTVASLASLGSAFLATDSGSVGVGTFSPTQKLDVIGYVRGATGLCIGGDCRTSWPSGGSGFSQVEYRTCQGNGVPPTVGACTAFCSAGWTLVSGGCRSFAYDCGSEPGCSYPQVVQSNPNSARTGWVCSTGIGDLEGTAICVK